MVVEPIGMCYAENEIKHTRVVT